MGDASDAGSIGEATAEGVTNRKKKRRFPRNVLLVIGLVAVAAVLSVTFLGKNASSKFSSVGSAIGGGGSGGGSDQLQRAAPAIRDQGSGASRAVPSSATSPAPAAATPVSELKVLDASPNQVGREVVSTGTMTVEVDDMLTAKEKASTAAVDLGGYVFGEQTNIASQSTSALTFKVPPQAFDQTMRDLSRLGRLVSSEVKTDDVTQQMVDLEARIRAAEASLTRVRDLVGRTSNVTELANLENEVQRRQTDYEGLLGQRQTLEKRTEMATVVLNLRTASKLPGTVTASSPPQPTDPPGFTEGFRVGWDAFVDVVTVAGAALGVVLPFAWVIAIPFAVVVWMRRFRRSRMITDVA